MIDYPPELGPRRDPVEDEGEKHWINTTGKVVIFLLVFLVTFASVASAVGVILIRTNQKDGRSILDTIQSCTNPKGECSKENAQQLAETIAKVRADSQAASAAAISCAVDLYNSHKPVTFEAVTLCQQRTLARDAANQ